MLFEKHPHSCATHCCQLVRVRVFWIFQDLSVLLDLRSEERIHKGSDFKAKMLLADVMGTTRGKNHHQYVLRGSSK